MNACVFFLMISLFQMNFATSYRLTDEEYELMPSLIQLDSFEKCLRRPGGRYCTAYATFVADHFNPLLQQMQEYSKHTPTRFNHTRTLFGTCLTTQKCENFHDSTIRDPGRVLEACLNNSVWKEYNLKVKVEEDISCYGYNEKRLNIGAVDIGVACVLLVLVLCNAIGSMIDICCTELTEPQDSAVIKFLLCFSLPRNWKRLTAPLERTDPRMQRLKGVHGIRVISMILVIVAHSMLPSIIISANPKFVEDQYDIIPVHILLNGTLIMQTFLFLSAFLLVYTFLIHTEEHEVKWRMLPGTILKRWWRLTPSYALVLAVTATWMRYLYSGPVWDIIVVKESVDCSRHWWKHLLYINNFEDDSKCMPQAWYLATDFQLYCLGVVVFLFCRSPTSRKVVLSTLFLIGLIIPALHTYYQDLDGSLLISPSAAIGFFITDRTFNHVYKRGHTNITCYIIGMAFGYLVYSFQKNNFDTTKYKKWRPLYWCLFPLGLSITVLCKVFYDDGPRVNIYYRVMTSAFIKPLFGLCVALTIVGMIFKMDDLYRSVLEWRGWTCPGRVTYSAYLLHVAFIRGSCGAADHPITASYLRLTEIALCIVVLTFTAAYVFWLTVEAPLGQLLKTCLEARPKKTDKERPKQD